VTSTGEEGEPYLQLPIQRPKTLINTCKKSETGWLAGLVLLAGQVWATRVDHGWQQEGGEQSSDSSGRGDRTGQEPAQSRNPSPNSNPNQSN